MIDLYEESKKKILSEYQLDDTTNLARRNKTWCYGFAAFGDEPLAENVYNR